MAAKKRGKRSKSRSRSGKGKIKTLRIKVRHPGGDLVSIQIAAHLKKVPKGIKVSKALLADMVRRKALTSAGDWDGAEVIGAKEGKDPRGIKLKITRWRNPSRKHSSDRAWRSGTQADAWGSLRNALAAAALTIR